MRPRSSAILGVLALLLVVGGVTIAVLSHRASVASHPAPVAAAPIEEPEKQPAERPAEPVAHPVPPAARPVQPATEPAVQPAPAEAQPAQPAEQPAQPTQPAAQPEQQPAAQPAPAQPAQPTTQPAAQAAQPTPAPTLPAAAPPPPAQPAAEAEASITIDSPLDGSAYHSTVKLRGRVRDSGQADSTRQIDSASWAVAGTDRSGEIRLAPDGSFLVQVPAAGLRSDITVTVRVRKKSGSLTEKAVTLKDAGAGPSISIASPSSGATYGSTVTVNGKVAGPADAEDPMAEVASLAWRVDGAELKGAPRLGAEGAFSFSFSTVGLHGAVNVVVEAVDRNGHATSSRLGLSDRASGPALQIDSPEDGGAYNSTLAVEGTAGDPSDPSGSPAEVKTISWRIIGSPSLKGEASLQKEGTFRFSIPTAGLAGTQVLELRAEDLNGRVTVRTLTVAQAAKPVQPPAQASQPAPSVTPGSAVAAQPSAQPTQAASREPPSLSITAPADKSRYGGSVAVSGRVTNSAADAGADSVASLSWSITGTRLSGTAAVGKAGDFSFVVKTAGLSGTQVLNVKAANRQGVSAERVIVLMDDGKGLPIVITSPSSGVYYKDSLLVEGRVADAASASELKALTYEVQGAAGMSGKVVTDAKGGFRLPLAFSGVSGNVLVRLSAEDVNGRLSQAELTLRDGNRKPSIEVVSPLPGGTFSSLIRVSGSVTDPYAGEADSQGIESLSWLISPVEFSRSSTPAKGAAALGAGNAFRFSLPTQSLSGAQLLTLTAVAKNGNRAETTVKLAQADNDVPSFSAAPSDRQIVLSWAPVPLAARYDLSYAAGGATPENGTTMTGVSSPVTLKGLANGSLVSLRLRVRYDDAGAGQSAVLRAVPLAPSTLAPAVKSDYQQIHVSWDRVPGADVYDVWRSLSADAGFAKIATALSATMYVDTGVEFGRAYYYAISPSGPIAPLSAPTAGKSLAFPSDKLAHVGSAVMSGARRVTVNGGYAFVASGAQGVRIVDVSKPTGPVAVGEIATTDAWCVAIRGSYAYVADGESGLRVLDISAPRAPLDIGMRKTSDARAVALSGTYAYVADGDKGLKVIDITDPRSLPRVASVDTENALDVMVIGSRLYLADGAGGLKIFDITHPAAPTLLATEATSDARALAALPGLILVADGSQGLRIFDATDAAKLALLATFDTGRAASVAAEDSFAYVTDGATGMKVVDLEDPAHPALFASRATTGAVGVGIENGYAYVANALGVDLMRIQIQGRSFRVASCETGGKAFQVTVSGDKAYIASHSQGVRVIDVADPSKVSDASLVGSASTRFAQRVAVKDALAFVADGTSGMRIIDLGQALPSEAGAYRPGGNVSSVAVNGDVAYVAAGDQGVHVLNVTQPSALTEKGWLRTTNALDIVVSEAWAFVADGDGGTKVLDISNPAKPVVAATVPGNARALALAGSLLAVEGSSGVSIVDVTDPRAPVAKGRYDTTYAEAVAASGRYVYVAEGYRGLTVLDVSRPSRPTVVSTCEDVFAVGVAVKGSYALVVDSFGLRVVQVLIPEWLAN
jgi:hypothetical protein